MSNHETKKILYGTSNFETLIADNGYYVDKTEFIEKIEALGARYLLFLRPRRFGKSLFLSTLEYYYDINTAEQFDDLFGGLYIGKNPTPLKNSFPILKLNFSAVVAHGTLEEIEQAFDARIWSCIDSFLVKYQDRLHLENIMQSQITPLKKASTMLARFIDYLATKQVKFYLLIDEYDNFANNILADHGKDRYQNLTHGTGFLRGFFTVIKACTDSNTIARMFATGVSPLLMSDVTSGFNIGENISQDLMFSEMVGFTQNEVETAVDYYIEHQAVPAQDRERVLTTMKHNYDGYVFSAKAKQTLYNSNSVLYLLNQYVKDNEMPAQVIDANMKTDYQKLRFLVIESRKLNGNFNILAEILQTSEIKASLAKTFALSELIEMDKFISFLYYLGFLTIAEQQFGEFAFSIPNDMCQELLWEYVRKSLEEIYPLNLRELGSHLRSMAREGTWEPLFRYIFAEFYQAVANRDFIFREEGVKGFLLAYLNMSQAYRVHSECELNKGYADIYIEPNLAVFPTMCPQHFLVELKYVKQAEVKPKTRHKLIASHVAEAQTQLEQYARDRKVPADAIRIVALSTNEELLALQTI